MLLKKIKQRYSYLSSSSVLLYCFLTKYLLSIKKFKLFNSLLDCALNAFNLSLEVFKSSDIKSKGDKSLNTLYPLAFNSSFNELLKSKSLLGIRSVSEFS